MTFVFLPNTHIQPLNLFYVVDLTSEGGDMLTVITKYIKRRELMSKENVLAQAAVAAKAMGARRIFSRGGIFLKIKRLIWVHFYNTN